MVTRRRASIVIAAAMLVVMASPLAAQRADVQIAGIVVDSQGARLPGVTVTIAGPRETWQAVADADGRFSVSGVSVGTYTATAVLPGFDTAPQQLVLSAPGSIALHFVLKPRCPIEVAYVDLPIPTKINAFDAVVYVRIANDGKPAKMESPFCLEGHEHRARVLGVVKAGPYLTSDIRLLRIGNAIYRTGDELVLFLQQHPSGVLIDLGSDAYPVADGRVHWTRTDLPGAGDGTPVEQVLGLLRDALSMTR